MGFCDKSVYIPAGQQIEAEHFADCNLSDSGTLRDGPQNDFYRRTVHFRPTTDSADTSGGLDIFDFNTLSNNKWVEYRVETTEAKEYTLSLRYQATTAATVQITVDGGQAVTAALDSTSWATKTAAITIPAGQHRIRLNVTAGNCALNWLKVE
jgi:hypothetical protein